MQDCVVEHRFMHLFVMSVGTYKILDLFDFDIMSFRNVIKLRLLLLQKCLDVVVELLCVSFLLLASNSP